MSDLARYSRADLETMYVGACVAGDALRVDLAAVRRERDEWEESAKEASAACHLLHGEHLAALQRAEKAEKTAAVWEQRCCAATALSGQHLADLAAARRERDRLRALLLAAADWFDAIAQKVGRGQLGEAQKDAEGRAIAYRAALEKEKNGS